MSTIKTRYVPEETTAQKWMPVLVMAVLGVLGVLALYYFAPQLIGKRFQTIELMLMLLMVGITVIGYSRRLGRGVISILAYYIATGIAILLYRPLTPYAGSVLEALQFNFDVTAAESTTPGYYATTFFLISLAAFTVLELLLWASFRDTRMPGLGILDKLGGLAVYLLLSILVASMCFNLFGYGRSRPIHDRAVLRRPFNQVLYLQYQAHSPWFSNNPPPLYTYDLNVR
ncbi:MAG: CvpA family protein [Anaerolineae bacterium]|nr:CvpA family protein [Anaerolineae bacterium]